jgi:alpha-beta hydrolase superfamily lysophospholipase
MRLDYRIFLQVGRCMPDHWAGVALSAPAFKPDPAIATPLMRFLARFLSQLLPKLPVDQLPSRHVSSDAQVLLF